MLKMVTQTNFNVPWTVSIGEPYTAFITKITLPKYHCIDKLKLKTRTILTGAEDIEIVYEDCYGKWKLIHYSNLKNQFDFLRKVYAKTFAVLSSKLIDDVKEVFIGLCDNNDSKEGSEEFENENLCKNYLKDEKHKKQKRSKRFTKTKESSLNVVFLNEVDVVKRNVVRNVIKTCEPGWYGENCSIADCTSKKNCSGAGYCISPNNCRCILNHYGDDCSLCHGPYCSRCDYHCVHGKCDSITKTCQCTNYWGGSACDVCLDEKKCLSEPKILMLLPQSGPILKANTFTFAHGTDFPKADSDRYSCIFGGIATEGRWLSPNLVRCMIPPVSHVGKHLFNLIPLKSNIKIRYVENRPIHYTFYVDCNPNICQGSCMGPQCICGIDRNGIQCEDINVLSNEIYNQTKVNEELANAIEGVPYRVNVPIKSDSTLISLKSEAINEGLRFDTFKGQLIWEKPIGRENPYEINVLLNHGFMRYALKWILNVKPSYEGRVININNHAINDFNLNGYIKFDQNVKSFQAPLLILIFSSIIQSRDSLVETLKINSEQNGTFVEPILPYSLNAINYSLCVMHPGIVNVEKNLLCQSSHAYSKGVWGVSKINVNYLHILKCDRDKNKTLSSMIKGYYNVESINFDCANSWEMDILFPREKISVRKLQFKDGNNLIVEFFLKNNQCFEKKFDIIGLIFCPNSKISSVVRQEIECQEIGFLRTEPEKIFFSINPFAKFSDSLNIKIFVSNESKRDELLKYLLENNDSMNPFFIVSLDGGDNFIEIEILYETVEKIENIDDVLYLPNKENPIVKIPYSIRSIINQNFNFALYLRSPLDDSMKQNDQSFVTVNIVSPIKNISLTRGSKMNDLIEFDNFIPGIYSISIKANGYNDYQKIESINENTKMLTIFMEPEYPYKPIFNNGIYSMEQVQSYLKNTPLVGITPSFISLDDNEKIFLRYIELYYEEGLESTFIVFNTLDSIYEYFKLNGKLYKLEIIGLNNISLCLKCKIKVLLKISEQNIEFDEVENFEKGLIIKIDYFVLVRSINWNYKSSSDLLIINKNSEKTLNVQLTNKYEIKCDCYVSTLQKCLTSYQSILGCSNSWYKIPDEIISIHSFASYILLKAECERNGIKMKKIRKLLSCLDDMEETCPIIKSRNMNNGIFGNFPEQLKNRFLSSFPNIKTLELQLKEIPILFSQFLQQLELLVPDEEIVNITDLVWFDNFIKFASDYSQGGTAITEEELLRFPNWYQGKSLIFRWNTMNDELQGEKIQIINQFSNSSIFAFQDLVQQSDKLKSLSRQFNLDTPFTMLHEVLNTLFSNVETASSLVPSISDDSCKLSDVYIQNSIKEVSENESFKVLLVIKTNTKIKKSLNDVKLNLEMKKINEQDINIQFRIIPNYNKYSPIEKITIVEWMITPMLMRRLTEKIYFKPVATMQFKHPINGDISEQRLSSQNIIINPMEFVRMYWFTYPVVSNEYNKQNCTALLSIMNAGYIELNNIELDKLKVFIHSENDLKRIPFKIVKDNTLMKIPSLSSGESIQIPFDFRLDNNVRGILSNISVQLTTNGRFPGQIQTRNFIIIQIINDKMFIVHEKNFIRPMIHFDIKNSRMTPIQDAFIRNVETEVMNVNNDEFRQLIIKSERRLDDIKGTKYGPLIISFTVPEFFNDISKIQQITTSSNNKIRYINKENVWINNDKLSFVDLDARSLDENNDYYIVFGNEKWNINNTNKFKSSPIKEEVYNGEGTTIKFNRTNIPYTTKVPSTQTIRIETLFPSEKSSYKVTIVENSNNEKYTSSIEVITSTPITKKKKITDLLKFNTRYTESPENKFTEDSFEANLKETKKFSTFNEYQETTTPGLFIFEASSTTNELPFSQITTGKPTQISNIMTTFKPSEKFTIASTLKKPLNEFTTKGEENSSPTFVFNPQFTEILSTKNFNDNEFIFNDGSSTFSQKEITGTTESNIFDITLTTEETTTESIFVMLPETKEKVEKKTTLNIIYPEDSLSSLPPTITSTESILIFNNSIINNLTSETLFPTTKSLTSPSYFKSIETSNKEIFEGTTYKQQNTTIEVISTEPTLITLLPTDSKGSSDFIFAPTDIQKENEKESDIYSKDYYKKVAQKIEQNPRETIQMACNNKKSHPIWGIICDVDKVFELESRL
uniref:EGF-like domain-containing protein n=1 Tax=Parastrongyloides trichosuri TaxID=131310 RepID=A0A0N4ZRB3_PARTI